MYEGFLLRQAVFSLSQSTHNQTRSTRTSEVPGSRGKAYSPNGNVFSVDAARLRSHDHEHPYSTLLVHMNHPTQESFDHEDSGTLVALALAVDTGSAVLQSSILSQLTRF